MQKNRLYCGDNLEILRQYVPSESVDLIYIDPPFNSKRDYNIFFDNKDIQTQRVAFEDTWSYKNIQESLSELRTLQTHNIYTLLEAYKVVAPAAFPYLVVMALRLVELHRVLKPSGSFYLHCDSTMSHYLKTICDAIFGEKNFRDEIIWKRTSSHNDSKKWAHIQDTILFYAGKGFTWNPIYLEHDPDYVKNFYRFSDERGRYRLHEIIRTASMGPRPNLAYEYKGYTPEWGWRMVREKVEALDKDGRIEWSSTGRRYLKRYLHEQEGTPASTIWSDIPPLSAAAAERLGYPTQKPKALLERIIQASSNPGDVVLDAFCGCGTTIDVAEGLHRRWIGIDISPVAISLMKRRMTETYKHQLSSFEILGVPRDEPSAIKLWQENAFAFQDWWLMEYDVFSTTFGTKGPDKGIDGLGLFADINSQPARVGFQVKGGKHVTSKDIDALFGAMHKFQCSMGVFLSIKQPSQPMMEAVASSDFVSIGQRSYPKLQMLTLHDHFLNRRPKLPPVNLTFKRAQFISKQFKQYALNF